MATTERLLKPVEAAKVIGCGRTTLFALIKSGDLESVLQGQRGRRIPESAIDAYIKSLREVAGPEGATHV